MRSFITGSLIAVLILAMVALFAWTANEIASRPPSTYGTPCYNHCTLTGYNGRYPIYDCTVPCNTNKETKP